MSKEKTGLKSISQGASDTHKVDPRLLNVRAGWNSRDFNDPENVAYIDGLAANIAQKGVLEAITVTWEGGKAWIDDGECRWRACMLAIERGTDIKLVPVKAEDRYASEIDRLVNQRLRNSGKQFSVFEDAKHFKRLVDLGCDQKDIALKANISAARVSQILEFNTVPEKVKAAVLNGSVSAGMAMNIVKAAETTAEAVQTVEAAVVTAKADGRTRALPRDVEGESNRTNIKALVKDAFEYSDVDDTSEEFVVIKMPADKWELIRQALKL